VDCVWNGLVFIWDTQKALLAFLAKCYSVSTTSSKVQQKASIQLNFI
jgi:hypothetical protein